MSHEGLPNTTSSQEQTPDKVLPWDESPVIVDAMKLKVETDFSRQNLENAEKTAELNEAIDKSRRDQGQPTLSGSETKDISYEPAGLKDQVLELTEAKRSALRDKEYKIAKLDQTEQGEVEQGYDWLPSQWLGQSALQGNKVTVSARNNMVAAENAAKEHYQQHEDEYIDNAKAHMESDLRSKEAVDQAPQDQELSVH